MTKDFLVIKMKKKIKFFSQQNHEVSNLKNTKKKGYGNWKVETKLKSRWKKIHANLPQ